MACVTDDTVKVWRRFGKKYQQQKRLKKEVNNGLRTPA